MSFITILGLWQDFVSAVTPVIVYRLVFGGSSVVEDIYSASMHFSGWSDFAALREQTMDITLAVLAARLIATTTIFVVLYISFRLAGHLPWWASPGRSFLLFYAPALLTYPVALSLAQAVSGVGGSGSGMFQIANVLCSVITWIGTHVEGYMYAPLFVATPVVGDGWFPSRMFPDNAYTDFQIVNQMLMMMAIVSAGPRVPYFYAAAAIVHSLYLLISLWRAPLGSCMMTSVVIALQVARITMLLACCIVISESLWGIWETGILILGAVVLLVAMGLVFGTLKKRIKNREKVEGAMLYFQLTAMSEKTDSLVCGRLEAELKKGRSDVRLFIASVFAQLVHDESERNIHQKILALSNLRTLGWMDSMVVFELCRAYCENLNSLVIQHDMDDLEYGVAVYEEQTVEFWAYMIRGKLTKARKCMDRMLQEKRKMWLKYSVLCVFHPQCERLSSFRKEYKHLSQEYAVRESFMERYSAYGKQSVHEIDEDTGGTTSQHSRSTGVSQQLHTIKTNIRHLSERQFPVMYTVAFVIITILAITSWIVSCFPFGIWYNRTVLVESMSETSFTMLEIMSQYSLLNVGLFNSLACTKQAYLTQSEIFEYLEIREWNPEPAVIYTTDKPFLQYRINSMLANVYTIFQNAQTAALNVKNVNIRQSVNFWHLARIRAYNYNDNQDLKDARLTILGYTTDMMKTLISGDATDNCTGSNNSCYCRFITTLDQDINNFIIASMDVASTLLEGCLMLSDAINTQMEDPRVNEAIDIHIGRLMSCFSVWLVATLFVVYAHFQQRSTLIKHFRPTSHPNEDIKLQRKETVEKLELQAYMFVYSGIIFVCACLYACQNCFMRVKAKDYVVAALNEQNMVVEMSKCGAAILSSFVYLSAREIYRDRNLSDDGTSLLTLIKGYNVELIKSFSAASFSPVMSGLLADDNCVGEDFTNYTSFHDIYRCWSLISQWHLQVYLVWQSVQLTPSQLEQGFDSLSHAQHVYFNHIVPLSTAFLAELRSSTHHLMNGWYTLVFEIGWGAMWVAVVIVSTGFYVYKLAADHQQLCDLFSALEPKFIARNNDLMKFIVPDDIYAHDKYNRPTSLIKLLEASGLAIVVITDDFVIIGMTKPILLCFGYEQGRLAGQLLSVLIPQHGRDADDNSRRFYEALTDMASGKVADSSVHRVAARCGDESLLGQRAKISLVEEDETRCIVVEFRAVTEELMNEEILFGHTEVFSKFSEAYVPFHLFRDRKDSETEIERSCERAVVLSVGFDSHNLTVAEYGDLDGLRSLKDFVVKWLAGRSNVIVIDETCTNVVVLFVDDKGNDLFLVQALEFAYAFADMSVLKSFGALVLCKNTKMILYPPPFSDTDDDDRTCFSAEAITDELTTVSLLTPFMKPGFLLISNDILEIAPYVPAKKVDNDIGLAISAVSLTVC